MFRSYLRDNTDHRRRKESSYEFLNRSGWKISDLIRRKVNEWMTVYNGDEEFIKMFKSRRDKQHYSAAFELLIYTLLTQSHFALTRHPDTKTRKKPDFLAVLDKRKYYVECTLAGHSFESLSEKNRSDTVEEIIDDIEYFPYWINLDIKTISDRSISKKKLLGFIDRIKELSEGISNETLFERRHLYEDNGWEVEISLLRKTEPGIKRSLGYTMGDAKPIDTGKPLMTALNDKKAAQYGIETDPYVICLNTSDLFTNENCFSEALFGQYDNGKINLAYNVKNGFYFAGGKPVNTSVSAVIIFRNFDLFTFDNSSIAVWHNPFAKNKLATDQFPFDEYVYELNGSFLERKTIKKEKDLFQLLDINKEEYVAFKNKGSLS